METNEVLTQVRELLDKHSGLKNDLREVESQLVSTIQSFKGSVEEAVGLGLVRFNFPVPPGYRKHLVQEYGRGRVN